VYLALIFACPAIIRYMGRQDPTTWLAATVRCLLKRVESLEREIAQSRTAGKLNPDAFAFQPSCTQVDWESLVFAVDSEDFGSVASTHTAPPVSRSQIVDGGSSLDGRLVKQVLPRHSPQPEGQMSDGLCDMFGNRCLDSEMPHHFPQPAGQMSDGGCGIFENRSLDSEVPHHFPQPAGQMSDGVWCTVTDHAGLPHHFPQPAGQMSDGVCGTDVGFYNGFAADSFCDRHDSQMEVSVRPAGLMSDGPECTSSENGSNVDIAEQQALCLDDICETAVHDLSLEDFPPVLQQYIGRVHSLAEVPIGIGDNVYTELAICVFLRSRRRLCERAGKTACRLFEHSTTQQSLVRALNSIAEEMCQGDAVREARRARRVAELYDAIVDRTAAEFTDVIVESIGM